MEEFEPRQLHLHTLESLISDLVSGREVLAGEQSVNFDNDRARSALDWYRLLGADNWHRNVSSQHGEDLVDAILKDPPELQLLTARGEKENPPKLSLKKMEVHRFAGIHKYGTPENAPAKYIFDFSSPLHLFEGSNGSGKTSLINAIIWALTGEVLRPQRAPEPATTEFDCHLKSEDESEESSAHSISIVSPLPDANSYRPENAKIPIDTWVELTFEDEDGKNISIRRSQSRNNRGKLVETEPDLSILGIDPIACRIGTVMPGLLSTINLGTTSELGHAVSELTGLASLVDLANHASRAKANIEGKYAREKTKDIERADEAYRIAKTDMGFILRDNPSIAVTHALPEPSEEESLENILTEISDQISELKTSTFESAKTILGQNFDPADISARLDIEKNITLAMDHIGPALSLPSLSRLKSLASISDEQLSLVEIKIDTLINEALKLNELAKRPDLASREQLYARIALWLTEHPDPERNDDLCVVCGNNHSDKIDPTTRKSINQHLKDAQENAELISQTLEQWAERALSDFIHSIPDVLRSELSLELPGHPCDLIRTAFNDELFEKPAFSGALSSLKAETLQLFDELVLERSELSQETEIDLPEHCHELQQALKKVDLAIRFIKWRRNNSELAKAIFENVLGSNQAQKIANKTLAQKLSELDNIVRSAKPLNEAIEQCTRLAKHLADRRAAEKRLAEYDIAGNALIDIVELGSLAQKQVDGLQEILRSEAAKWRSCIYLGAFPATAHELSSTSSGAKGELGISVKSGGVDAPAQHVTNASALRASLVAFYLAFWEHVIKERGGLTTIILDDPQELLDGENRERLAKTMGELVLIGAEPIVTSYDKRFAACVSRLKGIGDVTHRVVRPATDQNSVLRTTLPLNELHERKEKYNKDINLDKPAWDYADGCRTYLEATLGNLFDAPAHSSWVKSNPKPTFDILLTRLRAILTANPQGMFAGHVFRRFIDHSGTVDGSPVRDLMNKSHHGRREEITPSEVDLCAKALGELTDMAEQMEEECYRWRRRDEIELISLSSEQLAPLEHLNIPPISVILCPDLAAFTESASVGQSQEETDVLDLSLLLEKAAFYIRRDNFGFAAPAGSVAIVEAEPGPVADRRLVVARSGEKVLARRFLKPVDGTMIGLTAESPDPRNKNSRTVFLPENEVELHQVCGVIFDHDINLGLGPEEAVQVELNKTFESIQVAYRVRDTSAVPLALDKQIVLGGRSLELNEINQNIGALTALSLDDGSTIFKRIGNSLSAELDHLYQFESIGGLGSSEVLAVGKLHSGFRTVNSARIIIGVLYNSHGR